jgi:tetratricopeptide (TPR) repeat protein
LAIQRMAEVALPSQHQVSLPAFAPALDLSFALLTEQERFGLALLGLLSEETTFARWALGALLRGAHRNTSAETTDQAGTDVTAERILDRLVRARLVDRRIDEPSGMPTFRVPEQIRSYVQARMSSDVDLFTRQRAKARFFAEERSRGARSAETELRNRVYHLLQSGELSAAWTTAHETLALCGERLHRASTEEERADARGERGLALAALAEVKAEAGWLDEARQSAEEALETDSHNARPRALRCLAVVDRRLHLLEAAEDRLVKAEHAVTVIADKSELTRILRDLAVVRALRGERESAAQTIKEATRLCARQGAADRRLQAMVLWAKSVVCTAAGDYSAAEEALVHADALCADEKVGLALWLPWVRHQRALVALHNGHSGRAREFALRASEGFRDMHHRYGIAHCRLVIGLALLTEQNFSAAVAVLEEALQTFSGCGDPWAEADTRFPLAKALRHEGRLDEAREAMIQAAQDFDDLGDLFRRNEARGLQAALEKDLRDAADEGWGWRAALALPASRGRA